MKIKINKFFIILKKKIFINIYYIFDLIIFIFYKISFILLDDK